MVNAASPSPAGVSSPATDREERRLRMAAYYGKPSVGVMHSGSTYVLLGEEGLREGRFTGRGLECSFSQSQTVHVSSTVDFVVTMASWPWRWHVGGA